MKNELTQTLARLRSLLGDAAVFLACDGKKPIPKKWQKLTPADMTQNYLAKLAGHNIGVVLGSASNGICSIDLDCDDDVEPFLALNPALRDTLRTRGSRGCNVWIRVLGTYPDSAKLKRTDGSPWGEWRANGNQTVIHGQHPSGSNYQMLSKQPVMEVVFADIRWPENIKQQWKGWGDAGFSDVEGKEDVGDEGRAEHKQNEDSSSSPTTPAFPLSPTAPSPSTASTSVKPAELARAQRIADEDFARRYPRQVKFFENRVLQYFPPKAGTRNEFIIKAVPFLFRAVCDDLTVAFCKHYYRRHAGIFHDSLEVHLHSVREHLENVRTKYLGELSDDERELYQELSPELLPVFRIARDFALLDSAGLPPPLFQMASGHLGERLNCSGDKAARALGQLIAFHVLKLERLGTRRATGAKGVATVYRYLLPYPASAVRKKKVSEGANERSEVV